MQAGFRVGAAARGGSVAILIHDCLAAYSSVVLALILLGEPWGRPQLRIVALTIAPGFALVAGLVFVAFGLQRSLWRFSSIADLLVLVKVISVLGLALLALLGLRPDLGGVPALLPPVLVQCLLLLVLLGSPRFALRLLRVWRRERARRGDGTGRRVPLLLVGTGEGSKHVVDAVADDSAAAYQIVGTLDPSGRDVGRRLGSVPVLGSLDEAADVLKRLRRAGAHTTRVVLTEPIERPALRRLVDDVAPLGATVSRVPCPVELRDAAADGRVELRTIALADLLGRPQAMLDQVALDRLIRGRRVLLTGAGGSIGSELARQIAHRHPARLTLLDHAEYNLYHVELELRTEHPKLPLDAHLCDVRDRARVELVTAAARPELIFHAAALKHVPIVERDPSEGVLTNVIGTRHVADAARRQGALAFVLISTDKAVNPTSVMGASKRIAEHYVQALDLAVANEAREGGAGTRFLTVRFGNVLGSSGSVVPLFQRQLEQGGPLTVTHPEIRRYFMTIEEAVQLTLHASAHVLQRPDRRGEILVLDMGEPIRIMDVARQMIRLAGLEPERDIRIRITGLRPGEKLYEELFDDTERRLDTGIEGVLAASSRPIQEGILRRRLDDLETVCRRHQPDEIDRIIQCLVPGFHAEQPAPLLPAAAHMPTPVPAAALMQGA